jgi:hypothetical protein
MAFGIVIATLRWSSRRERADVYAPVSRPAPIAANRPAHRIRRHDR